MKNITKTIFAFLAVLTIACTTDDVQDRPVIEGIDAPQITAPESGAIYVLSPGNESLQADRFVWTKANYNGDVVINYTLEIDNSGGDFSAPQTLGGTVGDLQLSVDEGTLNLACLNLGATPFVANNFDVRIVADANGFSPMASNVISITVTPSGCLGQYAVGAGIPSAGWGWDSPLTLNCNNNVLTAKTDLINDTFRFFTTEGDWSSGRNFPYYQDLGYVFSSVLINAGDGDNNFMFTGTPNSYRLKIDENKKTITVARSTVSSGFEPTSTWLVGAATPGGWSWSDDNETEFPLISDNVYEVPVILTSGESFRVFLGNDGGDSWGLGDRNYPWYVNQGYTISTELENALDGDSNFRYTGPTGMRLLKIDATAKTITLN
ncbi:SusE domain-containing protein [uncultured Flavobacterium sp.]|uniref:SusE domain-containing protein n=1 Tax=uncultured Flavobacterium sp. TaxID=165435 RepID=UPI0030EC2CCE|tara:strand:- start:244567 stop:245700 length:1134 start_codon:yes stop_codon:yes gene_type:complete